MIQLTWQCKRASKLKIKFKYKIKRINVHVYTKFPVNTIPGLWYFPEKIKRLQAKLGFIGTYITKTLH